MKAQTTQMVLALVMIVLSGCATTAKYEAKVHSWDTHNAQALVQAWGKPDSVEKLSNGNTMFVYARLKHEPVAYSSQRAIASTSVKQIPAGGEVYIQCATYFQVTPSNQIVASEFRGDQCKSRD